MSRKKYERELAKLEIELVKLQGWIKHKGLKIAVIFEGRDSAAGRFASWKARRSNRYICSR